MEYFKQHMRVHGRLTYNHKNANKPHVHQQVTEHTNGSVRAEKRRSATKRTDNGHTGAWMGLRTAVRAEARRGADWVTPQSKATSSDEEQNGLPGLGRAQGTPV